MVCSNAKPKYQAMQLFLNTHILLEFKHYFEVTHNGKYILCIKFSQFDSIEIFCAKTKQHSHWKVDHKNWCHLFNLEPSCLHLENALFESFGYSQKNPLALDKTFITTIHVTRTLGSKCSKIKQGLLLGHSCHILKVSLD